MNTLVNPEELLRDTKELQEVFAAIAHQWRAPLSQINSIIGSIDNRLYEKKIEDPLITKQLLEIESIAKAMSRSIDDYRGYFQKKNDQMYLHEVIIKSLEYELLKLREEGIDISLEIDKELSFSGDELILKQILITLMENAKDAFVERNIYNPEISMEAFENSDYLAIEIRDNAGGISRSIMRKIFDSDFTTKHRSEGTGLGLFMVKKLMQEKFCGSIDVKNIEGGSCFTLKIPRDKKV